MNEVTRINGGAAQGGQPIQVNPVEAARAGLMFLQQRVTFNAAERPAFDAIEALLTAILRGQVVLTQAAPPELPALGDLAPTPSGPSVQ